MGLRWRMLPAKAVEEILNRQSAAHGTSEQILGFGDQVSDMLHAIMREGLDSKRGILQLCGQVLAREVQSLVVFSPPLGTIRDVVDGPS